MLQQLNVYVTPETADAARSYAAEHRIPLARVVEAALRQVLDRGMPAPTEGADDGPNPD